MNMIDEIREALGMEIRRTHEDRSIWKQLLTRKT